MAKAWLYDGDTALRHAVEAERDSANLLIRFEDGDTLALAPSRLVHVESRSGHEVYGRPDLEGWRLGIPAADAKELGAVLPGQQRYGRWIDRVGLVPAAVTFVAVSAAIVFAGWRMPLWLAPYIPMSWEKD